MAVVGFAVRAKGSPKGKWGAQQSFTDSYRVQTSSYADGPIIVLGAIGLPRIGQMYSTPSESHPWALCREYSRVERIAPNSLVWEVECQFETVQAQEAEQPGQEPSDGQGQAENPLIEIPEIDIDWLDKEVPVRTIYGDDNLPLDPSQVGNFQYGFTSSAGEMLDPQPTEEESTMVLTISRNEPITANHIAIGLEFKNSTNADDFWDALPGQALCKGIKAKRQTKMTPAGVQVVYLRATYTFHFRAPDWDIRPLDNGTFWKPSLNSTKKIMFKTSDGQPYRGLLDGAGTKLADGAKPHYLGPYKTKRRVPFAPLLLPGSFM